MFCQLGVDAASDVLRNHEQVIVVYLLQKVNQPFELALDSELPHEQWLLAPALPGRMARPCLGVAIRGATHSPSVKGLTIPADNERTRATGSGWNWTL